MVFGGRSGDGLGAGPENRNRHDSEGARARMRTAVPPQFEPPERLPGQTHQHVAQTDVDSHDAEDRPVLVRSP